MEIHKLSVSAGTDKYRRNIEPAHIQGAAHYAVDIGSSAFSFLDSL